MIKSLNDDLKSFNITYQKVINSSQKQRNNSFLNDFWDDLGTVLTVAGADIVGAGMGVWASKEIAGTVGLATGGAGGAAVCIAGGVIAGAGASVETVRHLSSENIDGFISQGISHRTTIAQLDIEYPKEYNYLKNVGKEHNVMVINLMEGKRDSEYKFKNPTVESVLNSKWMKDMNIEIKSEVAKYVNNGLNIDQLTESVCEKGYITKNMALVYNLFFNIYNRSRNKKNIENIINYYMKMVTKTKILTPKEKEALIASLSVASESPFYWLNQEASEK